MSSWIKPIAIKAHGRTAVSLFALGLAVCHKLFAAMILAPWPEQIIEVFRQCLSLKSLIHQAL